MVAQVVQAVPELQSWSGWNLLSWWNDYVGGTIGVGGLYGVGGVGGTGVGGVGISVFRAAFLAISLQPVSWIIWNSFRGQWGWLCWVELLVPPHRPCLSVVRCC